MHVLLSNSGKRAKSDLTKTFSDPEREVKSSLQGVTEDLKENIEDSLKAVRKIRDGEESMKAPADPLEPEGSTDLVESVKAMDEKGSPDG